MTPAGPVRRASQADPWIVAAVIWEVLLGLAYSAIGFAWPAVLLLLSVPLF